jgi:hypothetical protein
MRHTQASRANPCPINKQKFARLANARLSFNEECDALLRRAGQASRANPCLINKQRFARLANARLSFKEECDLN